MPICTIRSFDITWYYLMRSVGRVSFPLFCFLIVEGFLHTRDRRKYGRNLFVFALISEIPYNLTHGGHLYGWGQNVFFTLFMGFLALCVVSRWEEWRRHASGGMCLRSQDCWMAIRLCLLLLGSFVVHADYYQYGVSFIVLLYVLRHNRILQTVIGGPMFPMHWVAGLAFIPINLYKGRRGFIQGPVLKYLFYAFYPLQWMVIYAIKCLLGIV